MVVLEFFKTEKEVFYFKDKYECDFIVKKDNKLLPIQVSYEFFNNDTKQRDVRGLIEACKYLNIEEGPIITFD